MAEPYRYAAFISYSSKDAAFARRLHRALESYGIPSALGKFDLVGGGKRENRIYPVFRDREELSAGNLGEQIEAHLRASAALIVVCSPNGAASPWVQKEIEYFAAQGRQGKIFAIIPDSAPLFDEAGADATQSCFPPALTGDGLSTGGIEPLAADARRGKDGFRNAWLKIVAGMIGVTPGQIIDRDRQRRRQQALRVAAVWVLALLGVGYVYSQRTILEPMARSWLLYQRYAHTTAEVAAAEPGTTFQDCRAGSTDCPIMVVIPEGAVMMNLPPQERNEEEQGEQRRRIAIARVAVSQTEITFNDWEACVENGGCRSAPAPTDEGLGRDTRPVIHVSWEHAQEYVQWLSRMTHHQYRLLTEAEWEYAARAQTDEQAPLTLFSWGDAAPVCQPNAAHGAVFSGCPHHAGALPVRTFPANAFGLYDMHGNVWEWVQECVIQPRPGRLCPFRVARGGSWADGPDRIGSAAWTSVVPVSDAEYIGFRVARVP